MGDGRYDPERLIAAVKNNSQKTLLLDLEAIARESGAMINAVMLGAIAGAGALPIPAEAFEAAIRADGKAVECQPARLPRRICRGARRRACAIRRAASARSAAISSLAELESEVERMPAPARAFMTEGVRRLAAYQDLAYARLYLDRLAPIRDADAQGRRRRATAGGDGAASRRAHVLRGRDPRGAGQDRSGAFCSHRRADGRQAGPAVHRHRVSQARRRGILLDPAAMARSAHPRARRTA